MTPICAQVRNPQATTVVAVMGSQMAKSETALNVIGQQIDDDPAPCLYIAPTKSFCEKVIEPRLRAMLNDTPSLAAKKKGGKQEQKTQKEIAGVKIRLAWAGSATEISGDPAKLVFVDEYDRCDDDVGGEGDVKELADARHSTYAGGQTWVFSTPTDGQAETVVEESSGLEFWAQPTDPEAIQSKTWQLMLQGTRHHWAVPCPHCKEFFIPRFKNLVWPKEASAEESLSSATLSCGQCGSLIDQIYKTKMHARGVMVAPGQRITKTGRVLGLVKDNSIVSFWVSGLMSPWKTWGDRAAAFIRALNSGSTEKIQAVINTGFGELFSIGGERVDEDVVKQLRQPYKQGDVPEALNHLVAGADIQKEGIYWSVKGFGADMISGLIDYGYIQGDTSKLEVFDALALLKDRHYRGLPIERMFIDSGYRTSAVYEFCRRDGMREWAMPSKGRDTIEASPLVRTKLDVGRNSGRRLRSGLAIWNLSTDYFKRWLTDRFERDPSMPGAFMLPEDVGLEYIRALRSETRMVRPNGRPSWIKLDPFNHYFDCEVMALAAAYSLNFQMVTGDQADRERHRNREREQRDAQALANEGGGKNDPFRKAQKQNNTSGGAFRSGRGGWFGRR